MRSVSRLAMREAMRDDPVVEAHYAGLKPAGFRAEALPANRKGYVSYRIRDKIYWTRRMVTLQAGETVFTDGETMVRGRCGNLISAWPRQPVAPAEAEPAEIAMDQPVREAHLMLSPALPGEPAVATEVFHNPKQIGTSENMTNVLPAPDPQEMMPPVWTAGGGSRAIGGIVGVSSAGGGTGGAPTSNPAPSVATTPEFPAALTVFVSVSTHPALIEVAPPLVIVALLLPPDQPIVTPSGYVWEHALVPSPPPWLPRRDPPRVFYPPGGHPPREITPPPSGPPPANTPPPFGLPPHGLPPLDPPTLPPPGSPPPDTPVPEPSAWIMLALGLTGIAVGLFRRKF